MNPYFVDMIVKQYFRRHCGGGSATFSCIKFFAVFYTHFSQLAFECIFIIEVSTNWPESTIGASRIKPVQAMRRVLDFFICCFCVRSGSFPHVVRDVKSEKSCCFCISVFFTFLDFKLFIICL